MIRALLLAAVLLAGCSGKARSIQKTRTALEANADEATERSRQFTTGALDSLRYAPTNKPTNLAKTLLTWDQQLEGVPLTRLDVEAILADNRKANLALTNSFAEVQQLIIDRDRLATELNQKQERLLHLGALYEQQQNRNIVKRVWRWAIGTFGIGGLIALMFFFPFLIPIFGKLVAWLVGMFPKIAGFVGVVGKKSFDSVVVGVQKVRDKVDKDKAGGISSVQAQAAMDSGEPIYTASQVKQLLSGALSTSTDRPDKALIETRKYALAEMIKAEPEPLIQQPESSDPPKPYRPPSAGAAPLGKPDTVAELLEQTEIVSTPAKKSSPKPSGADTVSELLETTEIKTP